MERCLHACRIHDIPVIAPVIIRVSSPNGKELYKKNKRDAWSVCVYNERDRNILCLEAYMREVNDKTNKRVAQLSFMSLGLSITVSLFQVWHLKRFFLKKKLI
ncbi:unnamed protein product [Brassica oleracea]|uniref:(rape) hypothetical protein n=1 Tax=Brassica napus TaxID=3708 RepID=A0A816IAY2_BRANA|nr:unnamed protein product [Brassica napus]